MGRYKYIFINDNHITYTGNTLRGVPRIYRIDPYVFFMKGQPMPMPAYDSVEELVTIDKRYKRFKGINHKTAAIIALEENVQIINDMVFGHKDDHDQVGNMLLHLIEGTRKSKTFSGVHYLPSKLPTYISNFKIIDPPNDQGVYKASFDIVNKKGKTLSKELGSTLLPSDWSLQRVHDECLFALNHKTLVDATLRLHKSHTRSGIPVEMYFDEEGRRIATLYPIRL